MPQRNAVGPYSLISKLGQGAFGVVWLAEKHTSIATTRVALKLPIHDEIDLDSVKQEATLWVQASGHPNVIPMIEADIYDGQVVIVSEYAPSGSLRAWLKQHGGKAPSAESAIAMISGILSGLEHLHARSIIHRDLKPENILLQGEIPRLTDFGISRILKTTSQSMSVAGSPAYMAPEAFDGKRNEQTDIWSAGVIFYELLAGRLPFLGTDLTSLVGAILTRNPEPLALPTHQFLQHIVSRALHKDATRRYRSAAEFRADLRSFGSGDYAQRGALETVPIRWDQETVAESWPKDTAMDRWPKETVMAQPNVPTAGVLSNQSGQEKRTPHILYAAAALLSVVIICTTIVFLFRPDKNESGPLVSPQASAKNSVQTAPPEKSSPPPVLPQTSSVQPLSPEKKSVQPVPLEPLTPPRPDGIPGRFPESSTRTLTASDIAGKSAWELKIMRNEIYARHGYIFNKQDMKEYFSTQPWYKPLNKDVNHLLSQIEKRNVEFIKSQE